MKPKTSPARPAAARTRRNPAAMAALRREMLERARAIYRDEGLAALSIRRLAQEFGLSTMALYTYFPSKQALLEGLWLEIFEALLAELLPASSGRRAPARILEAHVRRFIGFWETRPDQFRMIYMSAQQTSGADAVDLQHQPVYLRVVALTRERVAGCATPPPGDATIGVATDALVAHMLGYLLLALGVARYPLYARDALRERTVDDILRAVARAGVGAGAGIGIGETAARPATRAPRR